MFIYIILIIVVMQNNNELGNKIIVNSRIDAILKKLDEIVKKHPEIVLKNGTYDYSQAPPEVRAEIDGHLEEMANVYYEDVLWILAKYYVLLKVDPSQISSSIAEYLLSEKESGTAFIPDTVIEDILDRFPKLKVAHPKIYEKLGKKIVKYPSEEREFSFEDVQDEEIQHIYREVENLAKAGTKGVEVKREKGFVHVKYTNAHPEVKRVLDETVENIHRKVAENIAYDVSYYYFMMLDDPSKLEFDDGDVVIYAKKLGATFIPSVVIADALNRFPKLREMYPEIAEKYKKLLK